MTLTTLAKRKNTFSIVEGEDLFLAQYADNTIKSYKAWKDKWIAWCADRKKQAFPARAADICTWLNQNEGKYKFSSISQFIAMLTLAHKHAKLPSPIDNEVKTLLKVIAKRIGVAKSQANAITDDDWQKIVVWYQTHKTLADRRNYAMLSLLRCCMLRISEVIEIACGGYKR